MSLGCLSTPFCTRGAGGISTPADFSQQNGRRLMANLAKASSEPGQYKGTYPSVLRGQRGGSQEGRREGSQGDHVRLCLHLPRRRRLHPHHAGGDLVNLADAKQRPRSESREPGKKPWRLASSSEAPQVNLLSSPNSSTDLHAHTRPLVFAGSCHPSMSPKKCCTST